MAILRIGIQTFVLLWEKSTPMLPAILAAVPALFQAGVGLSQMIGGRKQLDNLVRPEYKMPDEINTALTLAAQQYSDPYNQASINAARQVGASAANAVASGRDTGNLAAMLPAIVAQQNQGYNQIAAMTEQQKVQERAALTNMLDIKAKYKDMEWQVNKFGPYKDAYNEGRQRIGAGEQNFFGSLNSIGSIASMFASQQQATPGAAASYASSQANNAGAINNMIMGTSDQMSYPGMSMVPTTDTQSYTPINLPSNPYAAAGGLAWMMQTLGQNWNP